MNARILEMKNELQIRGGNMRYKTKTFQLIENYLKTCCDKCFRAHDVYDYIVANEMSKYLNCLYEFRTVC